ncbi:MAG: sec-independent protein translocase protein TatC [Chlamydiales bacterium]|jgi:sec-independent protein translocase protein TatC
MNEDPESIEDSRMSLADHLAELRTRVMRSVIAIGLVFVVAWTFHETLADWVFQPYERAAAMLNEELGERFDAHVEQDPTRWEEFFTSEDPDQREVRVELRVPEKMRGDAASQGFFFYMRVCFMFALFFGGPVLLWQMWQFIAAGLYKRERNLTMRYFPLSVLLFVSGVLFGYFMMVPYALYFLARMTLEQIHYWESIDNYWSFLTSLTLALGAVFQLPVVMLGLTRLGLAGPAQFSAYRGHFIVVALVMAAVLTPPDPFTQMLMAIPMVVLYEFGNLMSRRVPVSEASTE